MDAQRWNRSEVRKAMIIRGTGVTNRNPVIGWQNLVTVNNITVTTENTDGFPGTNLANPSTHLKWQNASGSPAGNDYITIGGLNSPVSYVAFAGHNFGSEAFTLTVQVQTATDSPAGWNTVVAATLITDDTPLIFQFTEVPAATGVRVLLTGDGVGNAEAAVMYVGQIMTFEKSVKLDVNHNPLIRAIVSDIVSGTSESGQFVGRMVKKQWHETKYEFSYLTENFYENTLPGFLNSSVDNPFFIAGFPSDYAYDTGYVWLTKDPIPEMHPATQRFNLTLEVRGIA